jgi:hypothetical protein
MKKIIFALVSTFVSSVFANEVRLHCVYTVNSHEGDANQQLIGKSEGDFVSDGLKGHLTLGGDNMPLSAHVIQYDTGLSVAFSHCRKNREDSKPAEAHSFIRNGKATQEGLSLEVYNQAEDNHYLLDCEPISK